MYEDPTTEQVVAYDRFWKLVLERLLRQCRVESGVSDDYSAKNLAA